MPQAYSEPSTVTAVAGEVAVVGPGGIVVSLTPAAAIETSKRLLAAGDRCFGASRTVTLSEAGERYREYARREHNIADQTNLENVRVIRRAAAATWLSLAERVDRVGGIAEPDQSEPLDRVAPTSSSNVDDYQGGAEVSRAEVPGA